MIAVKRFPSNPILAPNTQQSWEQEAAFNGCPIVADGATHLLYRAMSQAQTIKGKYIELSTIGHAISFDRVHFLNRRQLIFPQYDWEQFGCEDPRVTQLDGKFYIFYTALADFPPSPKGITVAVATTRDFHTIEAKHHVTPFNAKAMALFPQRVNNKLAVILTANTDLPPAKIAIAYLDCESQLWNTSFWEKWHAKLDDHVLPLLHSLHDHVEVGAPPIKTNDGWLLIYCYIRNYLSSNKTFGIEALLLDNTNPNKILGRTDMPLLVPEFKYELVGKIPNVIFPSGALVYNNNLGIYYGAADTTVCLATCKLEELLSVLRPKQKNTS
ncbi:hypothetical protein A2Z00_00875 [Candidatus Gottesmanbacteria bacterium RBG_13_45_10]|uniref:Glycosidase n=1 Tax=Candidatus Gottesmanbacteria bacterium RBG_13_45_10 TaxID=1798370 RepID=A0A1F5ZHT1_9BACT|nr:MAG: hypothetical protein A2Z00_00875 [Candidatus Gottesmanbacteria bacterium RBG_13_45_10]